MKIRSKYPRFFVEKDQPSSYLYWKINHMYGTVYYSTPEMSDTLFESSYTENGCDDNIKKGYWYEILESEIVLL